MIRHCVMFRWSDEATDERRAAVRAALTELPGKIPEIREYRFGDDAGLQDGNFDFCVTADFADRDGYLVYQTHQAHLDVVKNLIRPIITERSAIQFEL